MTAVGNREEGEKLIAKALSRHIGYTSGAYDLKRIFSVLEVFREESSAYRDEIVAYLGATGEAAHAHVAEAQRLVLGGQPQGCGGHGE